LSTNVVSRYRHYKTGGVYVFLAVSREEETGLDYAVYSQIDGERATFHRPVDEFFGFVDTEGHECTSGILGARRRFLPMGRDD
jgi:hypothetical protein